MEKDRTPRPLVAGYVVVVLGIAVWAAGCFLPLYSAGTSSTGYRLFTNAEHGSAVLRISQLMNIFGGVAAILVICVVGVRGRYTKRWAEGALLGAVTAWAVVSAALLLSVAEALVNAPSGVSKALGYWCCVASVVVIVLGTIMVVVAARRADAGAAHAAPEMIRYQIPPSAPGGGVPT